ncbi:HEAT repeat protein OS=Streptomyces griseorubiginosus OX=67304 GN=AQJ54_40050 PE=4 SV=1 [Streptomyces griseorubiginosus]
MPGQLRTLCGPAQEARENAFRSLFGNIFHQGTRYSASPYAVPFLTRIAVAGPAGARVDALRLLTRLAVDWHDEYDLPLGINTAAWRAAAISPEDARWYDAQIAAETDEEQLKGLREGRAYCAAGHPVDAREGALRSYDAVRAQLPVLLELLGDQDPEIRAKTAYLLGWFPEEAAATLPPLLACLDGERDPVCLATVLVAVGLLADHDPDGQLRHHLDHEHPLPRWAASATALTRLLVAHPVAESGMPPVERIAAELAASGAGAAPESATAHHAGDLHSYTVRSLQLLMGFAEDPNGVIRDIVALSHLEKTGVVPHPLAARTANLLEALFDPADTAPAFAETLVWTPGVAESPGRAAHRRGLPIAAVRLRPPRAVHPWSTRHPPRSPRLRRTVHRRGGPELPLPDPWEPFRNH